MKNIGPSEKKGAQMREPSERRTPPPSYMTTTVFQSICWHRRASRVPTLYNSLTLHKNFPPSPLRLPDKVAMAQELHDGEFWLPSEILTDDDLLMDFKTKAADDLSSATGTESDEDDFITHSSKVSTSLSYLLAEFEFEFEFEFVIFHCCRDWSLHNRLYALLLRPRKLVVGIYYVLLQSKCRGCELLMKSSPLSRHKPLSLFCTCKPLMLVPSVFFFLFFKLNLKFCYSFSSITACGG